MYISVCLCLSTPRNSSLISSTTCSPQKATKRLLWRLVFVGCFLNDVHNFCVLLQVGVSTKRNFGLLQSRGSESSHSKLSATRLTKYNTSSGDPVPPLHEHACAASLCSLLVQFELAPVCSHSFLVLQQLQSKTIILTLFRLGFFGRPWTGGGGGAPFLKNYERYRHETYTTN